MQGMVLFGYGLWVVQGCSVVVFSPLLRDESVDPATAVLPCSNRGRVAESGAALAEHAAPTRHSSMVNFTDGSKRYRV